MFFTYKSNYKWMDMFLLEDTIGEAVRPFSSHSYLQQSSYSYNSSLAQTSSSQLSFLPSLPLSDLLFIFTVDNVGIKAKGIIKLIETSVPKKTFKMMINDQKKKITKGMKRAKSGAESKVGELKQDAEVLIEQKLLKQKLASEIQDQQQQQIMKYAQKKIKIQIWFDWSKEKEIIKNEQIKNSKDIQKLNIMKEFDDNKQRKTIIKEKLGEKLQNIKIDKFKADLYVRERISYAAQINRYIMKYFKVKRNKSDNAEPQQIQTQDSLSNANLLQLLITSVLSPYSNIRRTALYTLVSLIPSPSSYMSLSQSQIQTSSSSSSSSSQSQTFSTYSSSSFNARNLLCVILEEIIGSNLLALIRMILINSQYANEKLESEEEIEKDLIEREKDAQLCMEVIKKIFDIMEYIGEGFIDNSLNQNLSSKLKQQQLIQKNGNQFSTLTLKRSKQINATLRLSDSFGSFHRRHPSSFSQSTLKLFPTSSTSNIITTPDSGNTPHLNAQSIPSKPHLTMNEYCTSLFDRLLTQLRPTPLFIHIISQYSTQSNCAILCSLINRSSTDTLKVLIQTVVPYALLGAIHAQKREIVVYSLIRMMENVKKKQKLDWVDEAHKKLLKLSSDSSCTQMIFSYFDTEFSKRRNSQ
ncbi:MAG: hypothetical protein EZS28_003089 [Streblomastix strix]|uniref:Uncharacterized protein n=1 Tax=Streblomastix strix TaxID=222440 RepID=A0A5J4X283_9EUKA|nr:MAG: hypothetical protein EZS28_003089 [Streblomastix strix]